MVAFPSLFSVFMVEVRSEIAPDPIVRKMPGGASPVFSGIDLQMYTLTFTDAPLMDYNHFKSKKILSNNFLFWGAIPIHMVASCI